MKMTPAFCNFQIMYTKLMTQQLIEVLVAQSVERLHAVRRVVGSTPHWTIRFFSEFSFESHAHKNSTHHCTEATITRLRQQKR